MGLKGLSNLFYREFQQKTQRDGAVRVLGLQSGETEFNPRPCITCLLDCSWQSRVKFSVTLVNSQLVCLRPVRSVVMLASCVGRHAGNFFGNVNYFTASDQISEAEILASKYKNTHPVLLDVTQSEEKLKKLIQQHDVVIR